MGKRKPKAAPTVDPTTTMERMTFEAWLQSQERVPSTLTEALSFWLDRPLPEVAATVRCHNLDVDALESAYLEAWRGQIARTLNRPISTP